jgi:hypothetical protein
MKQRRVVIEVIAIRNEAGRPAPRYVEMLRFVRIESVVEERNAAQDEGDCGTRQERDSFRTRQSLRILACRSTPRPESPLSLDGPLHFFHELAANRDGRRRDLRENLGSSRRAERVQQCARGFVVAICTRFFEQSDFGR